MCNRMQDGSILLILLIWLPGMVLLMQLMLEQSLLDYKVAEANARAAEEYYETHVIAQSICRSLQAHVIPCSGTEESLHFK